MKIFGQIRRENKRTGFTIIEVVIAAAIFTLAMTGIFSSVSLMRQPAIESTQEVTAAFIGKQVLDDLRSQVSAQTWNGTSGLLSVGNTYTNIISVTTGSVTTNYNVVYTVEADPDGTSARKVTLNVSW
jgi:prepilin-type N-terminal cleavage/methylation domain-containing protein